MLSSIHADGEQWSFTCPGPQTPAGNRFAPHRRWRSDPQASIQPVSITQDAIGHGQPRPSFSGCGRHAACPCGPAWPLQITHKLGDRPAEGPCGRRCPTTGKPPGSPCPLHPPGHAPGARSGSAQQSDWRHADHSLCAAVGGLRGGVGPCGPEGGAGSVTAPGAALSWGVGTRQKGKIMRVFVMGATGALGRHLVPALVAAGYEVTATTRSPGKAGWLREVGAEPVVVDGLDRGAVIAAVQAAAPELRHLPRPLRAHPGRLEVHRARLRGQVPRHQPAGGLGAPADRGAR
jgi:hypothetical protein